MNKIGIFSGTFDPVHMGHVAFALEAKSRLGLEEVVFIPELSPRVKNPAPLEHRQKMLELSLFGQDGLSVRVLSTPQFSVHETLPELQKIYDGKKLVLLIGSDVARTFSYRWPGLKELFKTVEIAISLRGEDTMNDMDIQLMECAMSLGLKISYHILPSPRALLASTHVRLGTHTVDDIHPDVADYIKSNALYA